MEKIKELKNCKTCERWILSVGMCRLDSFINQPDYFYDDNLMVKDEYECIGWKDENNKGKVK